MKEKERKERKKGQQHEAELEVFNLMPKWNKVKGKGKRGKDKNEKE